MIIPTLVCLLHFLRVILTNDSKFSFQTTVRYQHYSNMTKSKHMWVYCNKLGEKQHYGDSVVPAWVKVNVKGQGHKQSLSIGVHDLKNLYNK